jgi:outer membrane receptor for ferrienterochelin and colicins
MSKEKRRAWDPLRRTIEDKTQALSALSAQIALILSALLLVAAVAPARSVEGADLTEMSLETLMQVRVVGASRYEQKLTEAPSFVSIVTKDDIKRFGYRNLNDVLRSIPGVFTSYDRNYNYAGVRGLSPPGDYNTRILLVVDGHRVNNNVYDEAQIGNQFPIDIDLVERVEFVRGPSSSLYGSNAFFGILNVVTRRGGDLEGAELSASAASYQTYKGRATYGRAFSRGPELLLSGTASDSQGQNLFFPAYDDPATNNGVAVDADGEKFWNAFAKVAWGDFTLEGVAGSRKKNVPTGAYGTTFNDNRTATWDDTYSLDLRYEREFSGGVDVTARLFWDDYHYYGDFVFDPVLNKDDAKGKWWGAEIQARKKAWDRHIFTGGVEYRGNTQQDQKNYDVDPSFVYLDDTRSSYVWSAYLQGEFRLLPNLILNAGLRYDDYQTFGGNWSPRVGLIWAPWEKTAVKLLYGSAFRIPNVYELYYSDGVALAPNPALNPETIDTYEAVLEQFVELFGVQWKGTAAGYSYKIKDLITALPYPPDPDNFTQFQNSDTIDAYGVELELDGRIASGLGGRASYSYQKSEVQGTEGSLVNSPRSTAKLALFLPVWQQKVSLNPEVQYYSSRKTTPGRATESVGGYTVVNLTLFTQELLKGLELSATAYNLLDKNYADPAGAELTEDVIQQDGLNFRVKATYRF